MSYQKSQNDYGLKCVCYNKTWEHAMSCLRTELPFIGGVQAWLKKHMERLLYKRFDNCELYSL